MSLSSQVTNSKARASGQASTEDHSAFFPASIKYEPVDLSAASENKFVHEVKHPEKVKFEEFDETLSPLEPIEPFRFGETPRNDGKRYKGADFQAADISPLHTGGDDELERTTALRMRAINARLSPRRRPNQSDNRQVRRNPKKPNTRSSTLYKDLKKNDYYWF
ncbi:uncharacterized protein LOC131313413 [Rhododendron vialii]|uniref:uncharacterized protein LOC131313413 n=1 Tax=Rhododendron vialii TaxID=182163 RepID=UPI00265FBE7E|nr:uncharacterized protein LOC131313413 [Rhododendron vialii]